MAALSKNPRLIETKLADGIEFAWYPNCVKDRIETSVPLLVAVVGVGLVVQLLIDSFSRSGHELAGFPEVLAAYERLVTGLAAGWLLILPLASCFLFGRIWFDARRRRSIVVRNGIVWFETCAKFEKRGVATPFALTDIARIVVLRVEGRRYPARMVECFAADGKRLLWQRLPIEIIGHLARKVSELSGIPIEYRKPGEPQRRAKR